MFFNFKIYYFPADKKYWKNNRQLDRMSDFNFDQE